MTATHNRTGVPGAFDGGRWIRLVFVALSLAAIGFGLWASASYQNGWATSKYAAAGPERVVAVEFVAPEALATYTVRLYSNDAVGLPEGMLFEHRSKVQQAGYYSIPVTSNLPLHAGQSVVAMVQFETADGQPIAAAPDQVGVRALAVPEGAPEAVAISKFVVTAPPVIAGAPMTFTVSATGTTAGDAMTYFINYGDGTPVPAAAPLCTTSPVVDCVTAAHTYATAGSYTATLTVTDTADATTLTKTLTVVVQIAVTASASSECGLAPLNVCFTSSADKGTPPYVFTWNFGDGTAVSHEQNPCHAFLSTGVFTVVLTVTDSVGATGTTSITIRVLKPLSITLTSDVTDGIPTTVVNFCVSASNGLPPYTYAWDFGDGMTADAVLCPQHAYGEVGQYTATVTVTDSCGQSATKSVVITVHTAPWIRITSPVAGGVYHATLTLTSTVKVEPGVTVLRVDYFIDGVFVGSSSVAPYTVTIDTRGLNGSYTVTTTAYDSKGRTNSAEVSVVFSLLNPTVDGRVEKVTNPFRLKVYGTNFQPGCRVYINDFPAPQTVIKSSNLVVAKGDGALKAMLPKGVPVIISVVNPDGGISLTSTFVR